MFRILDINCCFFCHIEFCICFSGLLNGITTLSQKSNVISTYTVGIIAIVIGLLWAAHAMISFYMLVKVCFCYFE